MQMKVTLEAVEAPNETQEAQNFRETRAVGEDITQEARGRGERSKVTQEAANLVEAREAEAHKETFQEIPSRANTSLRSEK